MVIKIRDGSHKGWMGENGILLSENEQYWLECIKPYVYGGVSVIIGNKKIVIPNKCIVDTIDDDRNMYEYCSSCLAVQKKGLLSCDSCNSVHLRPLSSKEYIGCERILKESIEKVF